MRVSWIPDVLRNAGLTVIEYGQPRGRGKGLSSVQAVVVHDTVTTRSWTDERVANLLRAGRPEVPGPLAQLGPDRQGRMWVIADGRCNHNGFGSHGNNTIGIETFCAGGLRGQEEPWNNNQYEVNVIATAAILKQLGLPASRALGHKETDPQRKIDPFGIDMEGFRRDVVEALHGDGVPTQTGDEEMKRGDTGAHITRLCWRINQALHGHHDPAEGGLTVTNTFNDEVERYVRHIQSQAGYPTTGRVEWWTYDYITELAHMKASAHA